MYKKLENDIPDDLDNIEKMIMSHEAHIFKKSSLKDVNSVKNALRNQSKDFLSEKVTKGLRKKLRDKAHKTSLIPSMLPNMVTILGLCSGISALRFALLQEWNLVVISLLIAAFLDMLDGALARMLNASSRFGAELDSLSDFGTFGISPALIMYCLTLHTYGSLGWLFVLWFCVCGALRLARFNTRSIEGQVPQWAKGFFTGIPITSSALLCVLPLVLDLGWGYSEIFLHPGFVGAWMAILGFLMISPLPTFSVKTLSLSSKFFLPIVVLLVITTTALISHPWKVLSIIMMLYIATFPLSYQSYKKRQKYHGLNHQKS